MADLYTMATQVASVPTVSLSRRMVRCVPDLDLNPGSTPDYLFASGRPNRFNAAGVKCVYFADDEQTAREEYSYHWSGGMDMFQPLATYWTDVTLERVIDLSDHSVLNHLGMAVADLYAMWPGAAAPTPTQILGMIVVKTTGAGRISAIRYPSAAMRRAGKTGFNIAIFPGCVIAPDHVRVLGKKGKVLQQWP